MDHFTTRITWFWGWNIRRK